jgi:hypothetical protein
MLQLANILMVIIFIGLSTESDAFSPLVTKLFRRHSMFHYCLADEERELVASLPLAARILFNATLKNKDEILRKKDEALMYKDQILKSKDESLKDKDESLKNKDLALKAQKASLSQVNFRLLQVLGDTSLRRVIEEVEKNDLVKEKKKMLKALTDTKSSPSRKEIWEAVLNDSSASIEFPCLESLFRQGQPVPSVIADIFNFASKGLHTGPLDLVYIAKDALTELQVYMVQYHNVTKY